MQPQITELPHNIKTFFAHTYDVPRGIPAVFEALGKQVPDMNDHHLYGITDCDGEKLIYRACLTESYPGEADRYNLPYYNVPKGKYMYMILHNWQSHIMEISGLFEELMKLPDVRKDTICLEDYRSQTELWLMVQHQ